MSSPPGATERDQDIDSEKLRQLQKAVARLPRRQRLILLVLRFDDVGYDEIGARFGLTPRQVERASRARDLQGSPPDGGRAAALVGALDMTMRPRKISAGVRGEPRTPATGKIVAKL